MLQRLPAPGLFPAITLRKRPRASVAATLSLDKLKAPPPVSYPCSSQSLALWALYKAPIHTAFEFKSFLYTYKNHGPTCQFLNPNTEALGFGFMFSTTDIPTDHSAHSVSKKSTTPAANYYSLLPTMSSELFQRRNGWALSPRANQ
jgi:hypothetical protein